MYGKERIVLEQRGLVCACGSNSASSIHPGLKSGNYHPLGFWYKQGGLFYVDLTSADQWYSISVNKDTIANKRLGGLPTKAALRAYVMEYRQNQRKGGAL